MLSPQDVEFYRDNGYVVVPDVLSADEVARLRRVTDDLVEKSRAVSAHTDLYDFEDGHTPAQPRVRRLKTPHVFHEAYDQTMRHPGIIAVLQQLIGPDIRFDTSKLNLKAAGGGAPVDWHQDWAFYPHTNDDLCAVGVMIDDMDLDNGPLMMIPGSHQGPTYDHHADGYFCGAINDRLADPQFAKAVPLTGKAGAITVHHVRMIHGSKPNTSGRDRRLLLFQFRAADAWPLMGPPDWAEFNDLLITGEPSVEPRIVPAPVRMPVPPARHQGSIYENQRGSGSSILGHAEETAIRKAG